METSRRETELMQTINSGLPYEVRHNYENLLEKKQKGELSEGEYTLLLEITEQKEALHEEKLGCMIELAKMRNTTLADITEQLELKKELYVA